jgi:hypothetical protein
MAENETPKQDVLVLRGGFTEFQAAYRVRFETKVHLAKLNRCTKTDPNLVEKWRKEVWSGWY